MMCGNFFLHRREVPVDGICGIRYIEFGMLLIRKQIGQITFEREKRAAHVLVGIVPMLGTGDVRFFGIEIVPLLFPERQLI